MAASTQSRQSVAGHRAGIVASQPEEIHAIETTFSGLATLCTGAPISRPLHITFEAAGRDRCEDCQRVLASPGAASASRAALVL